MFLRAVFILIAAFWVTMNVLLWRAEYGQRNLLGGGIPADVVWRRVLTAQDASPLGIEHQGRRIGFCRWGASVKESEISAGTAEDPAASEGMVKKTGGYQVDLEGNITVAELDTRLRFDFRAEFSASREWQKFYLRLNMHPGTCEITATAADKTIRLDFDDGMSPQRNIITFADLNDPQTLFQQLGDPFSAGILNAGGLLSSPQNLRVLAGGVKCAARNDWVKIGRTAIRAYRMDLHLIDRYRAAIFVSRAGEILRVELPNDLVLVNEQLPHLRPQPLS